MMVWMILIAGLLLILTIGTESILKQNLRSKSESFLGTLTTMEKFAAMLDLLESMKAKTLLNLELVCFGEDFMAWVEN